MKDRKITIRLSEEEFKKHQEKADVCGMTISMYVREQLKGEAITVVSHGQELLSIAMNTTNEILRLQEKHKNMSFDVMEQEVQRIWQLLK